MRNINKFGWGLVILAIVLVFFVNINNKPSSVDNNKLNNVINKNNNQKVKTPQKDSDLEKNNKPVKSTTATAKKTKTGIYTKYSETAIANSKAEYIILNFSADWCPSCQTLKRDIESNLNNIPEKVEIYEVDYDTALELKKKYKVNIQHTLVEIKADGTMIKKWSGSPTLAEILKQVGV